LLSISVSPSVLNLPATIHVSGSGATYVQGSGTLVNKVAINVSPANISPYYGGFIGVLAATQPGGSFSADIPLSNAGVASTTGSILQVGAIDENNPSNLSNIVQIKAYGTSPPLPPPPPYPPHIDVSPLTVDPTGSITVKGTYFAYGVGSVYFDQILTPVTAAADYTFSLNISLPGLGGPVQPIPAGSHTITATDALGRASNSVTVTVTGTPPPPPPTGLIIQLYDVNSSPTAPVGVPSFALTLDSYTATTDADGKATFQVALGTYTLTGHKDGWNDIKATINFTYQGQAWGVGVGKLVPKISTVSGPPPASVQQGAPFPLEVYVENPGPAATVLADLVDLDSNTKLSGSGKQASLTTGEYVTFGWELTMPNKAFHLRVEVGLGDGQMTVTDSRDFTIALAGGPPPPQTPNPAITSVTNSPPSSAPQGQVFPVGINVTNNGATGDCWAQLLDIDSNIVMPGSQQIQTLSQGQSASFEWAVTMPASTMHLRIQVGYGSTLTDSKDYTIQLSGAAAQPDTTLIGGVVSVLASIVYGLLRK
jgi:hypothetical protein